MVQFDTILLSTPFGICVANIIPSPYLRACAASDSALAPRARGRKVLRLIDHIEAARRVRVALDESEQRHLQAIDEGVARLLAPKAGEADHRDARLAVRAFEQRLRVEALACDCSSGLVAIAACN